MVDVANVEAAAMKFRRVFNGCLPEDEVTVRSQRDSEQYDNPISPFLRICCRRHTNLVVLLRLIFALIDSEPASGSKNARD